MTAHEDAVFIGWMLVLLVCSARLPLQCRTAHGPASCEPCDGLHIRRNRPEGGLRRSRLGTRRGGCAGLNRPGSGHLVAWVGIPLVVVLAFTLVVGWNSPGPIGQPARAIKSIQAPATTEDIQSNYYRRAEEVNLIMTIRSSPILGLGFGRPFQAAGQLSKIDFESRRLHSAQRDRLALGEDGHRGIRGVLDNRGCADRLRAHWHSGWLNRPTAR